MSQASEEVPAVSTWQPATTLLEFNAIRQLLDSCVIRSTYVVPDALVAPIVLTAEGERWLVRLREQHRRLRPNESKLAVALRLGIANEVFVSEETDIAGLRAALHEQVRARKIMFPFVYGREVSDELSNRYPHESRLTARQSVGLLESTTPGIFQNGKTLVGPFGCHESDEIRAFGATKTVPAFKCPDKSCSAVHGVGLNSSDTHISKSQTHLSKILEGHTSDGFSRRPSQFALAMRKYLRFRETVNSGSLVSLISDALSIHELRKFTATVVRVQLAREGERQRLARVTGSVIANPDTLSSGFSLAECLNVLLLYTDSDLIFSLNEAVRAGELSVDEFEVRAARLPRHARAESIAELGTYGVRFRPDQDPSLPARQLTELVQTLCEGGSYQSADLAFALDMPEDTDLPVMLEMVFRVEDPISFVDSVIMSNRHALNHALRVLRIGLDSRDEVRTRLLWRLGLEDGRRPNDVHRLQLRIPEIRRAIGNSGEEQMRGYFANLFTSLETVMLRSLEFSTWAMLKDHFASRDPFRFDAKSAADSLANLLDAHGKVASAIWAPGEKPSLHQLGSGFGRLSKRLAERTELSAERPQEDWPPISRDAVRPFAFPWQRMYENLDEDSRAGLLLATKACARIGCEEALTGVRNAGLHGNNPFPTDEQISECLSLIESMLGVVDEIGLYPVIYKRTSLRTDHLGRRWATYSAMSRELELAASSWSVISKMPKSPLEAVIMPSAKNERWGHLRFAILPNRGPEDYWEGWPKVWEEKNAFVDSLTDPHSETDTELEAG